MPESMKQYEVEIGGIPHILQLTAEDAKRYEGAKEVKAPANKQAPAPANK